MIGISNKNPKYIDKRECFDKYLQLGSLGSVYRYFEAKGVISPITGRPPTRQAIKNAAFTFILNNIPVAKKALADYYFSKGVEFTDEKFNKMLITYGSKCLARSTYLRIMREQGLYDQAIEHLSR